MGYLTNKERLALTGQQPAGLAALVALAVLLHIINILLPLGGSATNQPEPFHNGKKGLLAVALNMDGQERGIYFMPPAATISDLARAAGATMPPEFNRAVGLQRLQTGDKINLTGVLPTSPVVVPVRGKMSVAQSLALDLPIDINQANLEELVLVPGIGEKTAARIIALRSAKGSLRSPAELKEIRGIKEKKFGKLKKYFFVP